MMANKDTLSDCTANKRWLQLFLKRKSSSLRKKTGHACQKTPLDLIPKLVSYSMHIQKLQIAHNFFSDNGYAI